MLMPKRVRYRKQHRPKPSGVATRGTEVVFGDYGLAALESGWITQRQIEAARIALTRYIKRGGRVWIKVFPIGPLRLSLLRLGWGAVKAPRSTGWLWLSRDAFCLNWPVLTKK